MIVASREAVPFLEDSDVRSNLAMRLLWCRLARRLLWRRCMARGKRFGLQRVLRGGFFAVDQRRENDLGRQVRFKGVQVFVAVSEHSHAMTTRWISRLGLALTVVIVGAYFAAMIADSAWDPGFLPSSVLQKRSIHKTKA